MQEGEVKVIIEEDGIRLVENSQDIKVEDDVKPDVEKKSDDPCIFDQATQTDDFLKGKKGLEDYSWNQKTKIAEIVLNDHWSLSVIRGGCDTFELTTMFMYDRTLDFEQNKAFIFERIIWITSLLDDYHGALIKETLETDKISIQKDEDTYYVNLMHPQLYESYMITFTTSENGTNFQISYFLS